MAKGGTKKGDWRKRMRGFVKANTSLTIIISALLLIELMMGVMYYAAQNFIQNTMERLVRVEMNAIYLCIRNKLANVEVTLDNMAWVVGESLEEPEWMLDVTHRMVKNNPVFWGSGVAFVPNYYPREGRLFEPYSVRRGGDSIVSMQLGKVFDHTKEEYFRVPLEQGRSHWSEPYKDIVGAKAVITTYSAPTPRQLSHFISGGANDEDEEARNYNYGAINTLLEENTLDAFLGGERQPIGNVLLTGATGFLGIHILQELIERDDVPVIWCLVRGEDDEKAERRLKSLMFYYFNKNYNQLFGNRLRIINGDVTQDFKVDGKIDTVFNCAAVVKHFSKGTEIEDVNVGGALNCVKFCLLNNARLIHVSTYSTAGMSVDGIPAEDSIYTEQKLYFGQNLGNQYIHSKFISERIVLDAVALHKLNAKIMRVGNLAPRSTDGEFQINFNTNSAMGRIRVYQMLGCYPYAINDEPMEFTPINEVAKAIVLLSETPQECCVFHPFNNHFVHFGDVLQELSLVTQGPRQVEADEFNNELEAAKQDPEKAKRLSSLLAYQDMAHGQKVIEIPSENQYTTQVLYRLGFRWSPTSWNYVDQMLTAIAGFGFFE